MPSRQSATAKALTIMAIGMGIGFGTCSLAALNSSSGNSVSSYFIGIGAVIFFLCLAGIVITGLIVVVIKIRESFRP